MPLKQATFDFENPESVSETENIIQTVAREIVVQPEVVDLVEATFVVPVPTIETAAKKSTRGRMKLSDMNACAHLIEVPEDDVLFQKRYYSIGTVSAMFKVNASLIRF